MHPNPVFRTEKDKTNLDFARERAFGALAVSTPTAPLISHVPFLLSESGAVAGLHLVRSNPIARALDQPVAARIAVPGPDSYISPDWYGIPDQVPTWNYVAIHLTGTLERLPDSELRGILDRQSKLFEDRLLPKKPWTVEKMPEDVLAKLMRMIVPCRLTVKTVDGTWKLSQNKPDAARRDAAELVDVYGMGQEFRVLSAMMRAAGEDQGHE